MELIYLTLMSIVCCVMTLLLNVMSIYQHWTGWRTARLSLSCSPPAAFLMPLPSRGRVEVIFLV
jgi:hypothetical protein